MMKDENQERIASERTSRARRLVAEWRRDHTISNEELVNTLEASLDALEAAEARAKRAEAYARDAEDAAARACIQLLGQRHDGRPERRDAE